MKLAVLRERRAHERRVAATPDTVRKLKALGLDVAVESGAGFGIGASDADYAAAGAEVVPDAAAAVQGADIVFKIQRPLGPGEGEIDEEALLTSGQVLVGQLDPFDAAERLQRYATLGITAVAMELMPRITRAQSMDILSSQANLAGYRAVIECAHAFGRGFPMLMTAAGTVAPARVLVMGAGVAGLQAIATARRLGAIVSATDVRPAAKEQVQSLGGTFVAVEDDEFRQAETAGGYAKQMSPEYQAKQAALIAETVRKQDIVICTALIPGRPAPVLLSAEAVRSMKPGSVILDMAVERGGNCALSKFGETVEEGGVSILGPANLPSRIPVDASTFFARNLLTFLTPYVKDGTLQMDAGDEILRGTVLTRGGAVVHPSFAPAAAA